MIDLEAVTRIRQLHYGEHWPVGTIAKELGLHHKTVQRALSDAPRRRPAPRPSRFDPYVGFVREVLARYPRLTATRIWYMLRDRGCPLSVRQVRERVAELRPSRREAFLKRRTFSGEEGLCGIPHRPSYAAPGNMRRPPKPMAFGGFHHSGREPADAA